MARAKFDPKALANQNVRAWLEGQVARNQREVKTLTILESARRGKLSLIGRRRRALAVATIQVAGGLLDHLDALARRGRRARGPAADATTAATAGEHNPVMDGRPHGDVDGPFGGG